MLHIVWTYRIHPEKEAAFVDYYGPEGDWVRFFRQGNGYRGTTLLQDDVDPQRYLTIDTWDERGDFDRFKRSHKPEYDERDKHCADFTVDEKLVGYFEEL